MGRDQMLLDLIGHARRSPKIDDVTESFDFSASPRGAFIQRFLSRPHPYNLVCVFQGPDERARYQQLYQAEKTPFHLVFSISKRPSTHVRRSHQLLCQIISRGLFLEDLHRLIFSLDADSWSIKEDEGLSQQQHTQAIFKKPSRHKKIIHTTTARVPLGSFFISIGLSYTPGVWAHVPLFAGSTSPRRAGMHLDGNNYRYYYCKDLWVRKQQQQYTAHAICMQPKKLYIWKVPLISF